MSESEHPVNDSVPPISEFDDAVRDGLVWYWDPDGKPISLHEWAALYEKRVELALMWKTVIQGAVPDTVTTAWLGINDGQPLPEGDVPQRNWGTLVGAEEIFAATREQARADHRSQWRRLMQQLVPAEELQDEEQQDR